MFSRVATRAEEFRREWPQMHISKEGDEYLRTLLVQGAHYIPGPPQDGIPQKGLWQLVGRIGCHCLRDRHRLHNPFPEFCNPI